MLVAQNTLHPRSLVNRPENFTTHKICYSPRTRHIPEDSNIKFHICPEISRQVRSFRDSYSGSPGFKLPSADRMPSVRYDLELPHSFQTNNMIRLQIKLQNFPFFSTDTVVFYPGVKQPKLKAYYLHPCSVKVKNEWSCTLTTHMHLSVRSLVLYNEPVIQ
jgi:hypothetical protein